MVHISSWSSEFQTKNHLVFPPLDLVSSSGSYGVPHAPAHSPLVWIIKGILSLGPSDRKLYSWLLSLLIVVYETSKEAFYKNLIYHSSTKKNEMCETANFFAVVMFSTTAISTLMFAASHEVSLMGTLTCFMTSVTNFSASSCHWCCGVGCSRCNMCFLFVMQLYADTTMFVAGMNHSVFDRSLAILENGDAEAEDKVAACMELEG